MKKWMTGLTLGVLILILGACGNAEEDPAEVQPGTEEENKSELTLQDVFQKAQEVANNVNGMHIDMDMKQSIATSESGEEITSLVKIDMDLVHDPLSMYQLMDMDMGDFGTVETELYLSEEGMFMKNPEGDGWMKFPTEGLDELVEMVDAGPETTIDYDMLEEFIDEFTFEQNDEHYILKLQASGDKFNKLMREELASSDMMNMLSEDELDVLENMKTHQLDYEIWIDKETYETTAFELIIDVEMNAMEEVVRIKQDAKAKMSQINEIEEIEIPQEVIENAVQY